MSGVLDATANIWYVLATRAGLFGIAVVLTSLYSGVTVLLARVRARRADARHAADRAGARRDRDHPGDRVTSSVS